MPGHYFKQFDLSKYTLKSFDTVGEYCLDTNAGNVLKYNAAGTVHTVADNVTVGQGVPTPFYESAAVGGAVAGGANSATTLIKSTSAIADATATTIYTVTVPNAQNSATISVTLTGILGAGGAVGAGEEVFTAFGQIVIARTSGLACVATATALTNTGKSSVAGGDSTGTFAYSVTSMTGANSATQTFNIQVTISHGAGSSTNHVCLSEAVLYNANATGITIA